MDEQGAQRLVARIEREPGWRAEARSNGKNYGDGWTVKAWDAGCATVNTFTTPYDWYYLQAKMAATIRSMKARRLSLQQSMRLSRKAV